MERRRRTDDLPHPALLPNESLDRARVASDFVAGTGFALNVALHVPDDGAQGIVCAASGRVEPMLDIARGLARRVARDGQALQMLDTEVRGGRSTWRHAAIPVGRSSNGTFVLVASDPRLSRREGQALAVWAAPAHVEGMTVRGGSCGELAHQIAEEFDAGVVAFALFAQSGLTLNLHVRSGAMLHSCRVPSDTVWGEVARHGAAFTLGDLPLHAGAQLLASVGMKTAGLVGLENGHGLAVGALGVASAGDLDIDVAHHLLAHAPVLGPELMKRLSTTRVPVAAPDGTVDLRTLAARVGCNRFAMYERDGAQLRLVAAHTTDGSRLMAPADPQEAQLVHLASSKGVGVMTDDAAAVLIGDHTVLYAQDPAKRALDCLRRALQDVRRNPFGGEDSAGHVEAA